MRSKLSYNPLLSVAENAANNGVTISAVRKFIRENGIDRKGDEALLRLRSVKDLLKSKPDISITEIARTLGMSYNTAKKYYRMDDISTNGTEKVSTFDTSKQKFLIKSVSTSQDEILTNILRLFVKSQRFDVDLTYSIGVFYKRVPQPSLKFDKYPQCEDVRPLNEAYTLPVGNFESVVCDLPFIVKTGTSIETSMISRRFKSFLSVDELKQANVDMLNLAHRLLKKKGILVMKTMDTYYAGKQHWVSMYVQNAALEIGFELEDTFVLIAKGRPLKPTIEKQHHARKYHSYFFVFKKK